MKSWSTFANNYRGPWLLSPLLKWSSMPLHKRFILLVCWHGCLLCQFLQPWGTC